MKKDKTLIVAIATVAILVVMFAGVTYAFFTASNNNISASTVAVTGGAMKITYSDGTNDLGGKLTSTDFQPGNDILVDKTFTLVGKNTATADTGLDMEYYIGIQYESTFSDGQLHWYLKRTDSNSNVTSEIIGDVSSIHGTSETGYNHGTFSPDDIYVKLVTGIFKPNKEEQSITFNLKMQFPDTGVNQDENKGAYFNGKILINEESLLLSDYMVNLAADTETREANGLEYDDTADKNLRYVGSNPNNYIKFNDETWRIIGIVDGGVKIIRQDRITDADGNNTFKWAASINDWTTASLQTYLNGTYYNSLTATAKEQIEERTWDIGGWNTSSVSATDMYTYERGETVYTGSPTDWTGNIALMYPSDWGYASTNTSFRTNMYSGNCSNSNWLYTSRVESGNDTSQYVEWTLSPYSSYSNYAFLVYSSGFVNYDLVYNYFWGLRPVVYLKSNISKVQGDGSKESPFVIA